MNGRPGGRGPAGEKGRLVAALDIGSSKISCVIAQTVAPKHRFSTGQEHKQLRILGVGHQASRGIKSGNIVDLDEAERAIRLAVDSAERMAQRHISSVYVSISGGRPQSHCCRGVSKVSTGVVSPHDVERAVSSAVSQIDSRRRDVLHLTPVSYDLDSAAAKTAPLGMHGEELGVSVGIVTADSAYLRNLAMAVERSHLGVAGHVIAPYAAGRSVLADDEMELGTILIEMGGATTGFAIFHNGSLIHSETVPVGGQHVTSDIARGLSTTIAHAERLKNLLGSALGSSGDDLEMIAVPLLGERGVDTVQQVPRSHLTGIIRPRIDETFEMVAKRLANCPVSHLGGQRVVLTGGASQLTGVREVAAHWLQRQVRVASPMPISGMPDVVANPGFSVAFGLLAYGLRPDRQHAMPSRAAAQLAVAERSYMARVGRWLAESF
jgi:cell division protein FtsA